MTQMNFNWEEGQFRLRNARLYQGAIPWVFRCVLRWQCSKDETMSYKDYIDSLRSTSFSKTELKRIFNLSEIKYLDDKDHEKWDTTCLYKVIGQIHALATPAPATLAPATPAPATPAPATPALATPALATPALATTALATPGPATPALATPGPARPAPATPASAMPALATPAPATPAAATSPAAAPASVTSATATSVAAATATPGLPVTATATTSASATPAAASPAPATPAAAPPATATPAAAPPSWATLDALLKQCKDRRNAAAHEVTETALSESYFSEVKPLLEKLLDTAADYFGVTSQEKKKTADELKQKLNEIEDGEYKDQLLLNINKEFLPQAKNEMKDRWNKFKKLKLFFSSDVEVDTEAVYSPAMLQQWREADTGTAGSITVKDFGAENIFGKWPGESDENIKVLSGNAGSGKTFLSRLMFMSWLGLIKVKFNKLQEFELLLYMQCRDRHESLKELIEANYPETCSRFNNMDQVVDALNLPGTRILYVVDGADEQNDRSRTLLINILDQFSPDTLNRCLLTSRPHEVESVKRLLYNRRLSYQGCTITELTEERQIKTLELFLKQFERSQASSLQSSAAPVQTTPSGQSQERSNVVDCFKKLQIKSVFHHPLNLLHLYELYMKYPSDVETWTGEADVMHAMYKFYIQLTVQKLKDNNCHVVNLPSVIRNAFAELGKHCLKLFQEKNYCFTTDQYNQLKDDCFNYVLKKVDYETVFSIVMVCEKDALGKDTGIYNFPHRSVQEHLQAMAVIAAWEKDFRRATEERRALEEEALIAGTLVNMIQTSKSSSGAASLSSQSASQTPDSAARSIFGWVLKLLLSVFGKKQKETLDFNRYDKTIQFIILELLRTHRPRAEDNVKGLTELLRRSGVTSFQYWAGLVSGSRLHRVVVYEAAVAVATDRWDVGPGEVEAADAILADMEKCTAIIPALVAVDIPSDVATPDTVPSLLRTVGDVGGRMRLGLCFYHAYLNSVPCDALLAELNNSPVLDVFLGCLLTPGRVLAPLITPDSQLWLTLTDPDHDLDRIRDREMHLLSVCLWYSPSGLHSIPLRRPLPRAGINILQLDGVPAGELEWPYRCLTALVPEDKGYDIIRLGYCGLSNSDLDELRRRAVQTVAVSSEEGIEYWTAGGGAAEGWSTESWGTKRVRSDGTKNIHL